MLSETGDPLWGVLEDRQRKKSKCSTNINTGQSGTATTLVLGNQLGYSADDEKLLLGIPSVREVSLGSLSLLTSQCITITHHYLDRLFELVENESLMYISTDCKRHFPNSEERTADNEIPF